MSSPLDRLRPSVRRAPYTVEVTHPLTVGDDVTVTVVRAGDHTAAGPIEVALVCRAADNGALLAEVTAPVDAAGGAVTLTIPAGAPATAEGDELVNAWTVLVRAVGGRRRNVALPAPVWVGAAE